MALTTLEKTALVQWTDDPSVRYHFHGNGPETEEDVTQETFVRLLQRNTIIVQRSVQALAWRTAVNIRKDLAKKAHAQNSVDMNAIPIVGAEPADVVATSEFLANLRTLIGQLEPEDRRIIELRYFDDLLPATIAQIVGITPSAVVMRVGRARKRLSELAAKTNVDLFEGMYLLDAA